MSLIKLIKFLLVDFYILGGGIFGGGGSDSQTVTQRTQIPNELKPLIRQGTRTSGRALNRLEGRIFGNDLTAGFDPLEQESFGRSENVARGGGDFIPTAQQTFLEAAEGQAPQDFIPASSFEALDQTASGNFLFGGDGFNEAVEAAQRQSQPNILSTFGSAGRLDSGLAQEAIAQANSDAFARLFNAERGRQQNAAGVLADLSNRDRSRRLQAAGQLPQIGLADSQILQNVGQERRNLRQQQIDRPISALQGLIGVSQGAAPTSSLLGSQSTQPLNRNVAGNVLGGAATGVGIGGALTEGGLSALGVSGALPFAAGGALLGGLLS